MSLLQMSLSGAVMILAVVVIRALAIHRLPKKVFLLLWDVVLVRLLIPYFWPSALSVYSLLARCKPRAESIKDIPAAQLLPVTPPIPAAVTPGYSGAGTAAAPVDLWALLWLAGALGCAVFFAIAYLKCRGEFKVSLPVDNDYAKQWLCEHPIHRTIEIRQSDRITAPLTYGVFHPVILMPKAADWDDVDSLRYVLAHEYVHICRFDAVTKLVLTAAACVHWFDPAVWVMVVLANRDIELSCDEAVVRRLGEDTKTAYAMTLIRMEEVRSGFIPLYNSFSKNALEERIIAIMKIKRTSLVSVLSAIVLVVGIVFAFATSGQTAEAKGLRDNAAINAAQSAEQELTIGSYTDPSGRKIYYTWEDSGETWIQSGEELQIHYTLQDVEWWTAEEYAAWLENEKKELQAVIGSRAWTSSDGWFTWTQEKVDETIAMYEGVLENIENGMLYSRTADGEGDLFGMILDSAAAEMKVCEDTVSAADFSPYTPYGLKWDEDKEALFWNGRRVRYFLDGADLDGMGGMAIWLEYADGELEGEVDVRAVRKRVKNADGSIDPMGPLTGLETYSQAEFDARTFYAPVLEAETSVIAEDTAAAEQGTSFEDRFARYADFGITYVEAEGASGAGNVYFNGRLVRRFADIAPDGSAFSFTSAKQGGITLRTLYDSNGRLAGVETV